MHTHKHTHTHPPTHPPLHHTQHQVLCERCSGLCNGQMIPAVEDFTQRHQLQLEAARLQESIDRLRSKQRAAATDAAAEAAEAASLAAAAAADSTDPAAAGAESAGPQGPREQLLGKLLVSPEELREKLLEVRSRKAVVVLLVDLLDASGTLMGKVRAIW